MQITALARGTDAPNWNPHGRKLVSLSKRIGFILPGTAALCLLGSGAMAGGGYLARVGPTPLRFALAAPRLDPALVLPPLKMADESATTNSVENIQPITDEADPEAAPEIKSDERSQSPVFGPLPAPPNTPETNAITTPVTGQLAPQMLLRFFTPDKKAVVVPEPLQFTPPPPPPSRGSSATYTSP